MGKYDQLGNGRICSEKCISNVQPFAGKQKHLLLGSKAALSESGLICM